MMGTWSGLLSDFGRDLLPRIRLVDAAGCVSDAADFIGDAADLVCDADDSVIDGMEGQLLELVLSAGCRYFSISCSHMSQLC